MKIRLTGVALSLAVAACLSANAQTAKPPVNEPEYNKPAVFADLPERSPLRTADAERLLNLPVGASVNTLLAPGLSLRGTVVSKSNPKDVAVQSVVVKLTGRGGAALTFTRIRNADGSFIYRGRLLGKSAGDALEIVREGSAYVLRKRGYYDLVNE